jgi:hypothetical protein
MFKEKLLEFGRFVDEDSTGMLGDGYVKHVVDKYMRDHNPVVSAHVFQHRLTGAQMFIFHCSSQEQARQRLVETVRNHEAFIYLTIKDVVL